MSEPMVSDGRAKTENLALKSTQACGMVTPVQTIEIQLPDQMARQVEEAVKSGTFSDSSEVVLAALRDFVSQGRFKLMEEQQLRDIAWAKSRQSV